jgi:integrin beta 8
MCAEVDPIPGEGSKAARRTLGGKEIGVGHGGVEYHLKGHGGILPGYPTPEGMRKLIFERMKDDRLRAVGGMFSTFLQS